MSTLSKKEKAAALLLLIPQQQAIKILSSMNNEEIRDLSYAMANLGLVSAESINQILDEFCFEIENLKNLPGDFNSIHKLLSSVLGNNQADTIIKNISNSQDKSIWTQLSRINEDIISKYLQTQHPQSIAIIISRLPANASAKILSTFSQEMALDILNRLLNIASVQEEAITLVEKAVQDELLGVLGVDNKYISQDSHNVVASILNNFNKNQEDYFLNRIEQILPEDAEKIKTLMFTFEDLMNIDRRDIIKLIDNIANKQQIAIALKGSDEKIRSLFFDAMPSRQSAILIEEIESLGPIRATLVQQARNYILQTAKHMIDRQEIGFVNLHKEQYI